MTFPLDRSGEKTLTHPGPPPPPTRRNSGPPPTLPWNHGLSWPPRNRPQCQRPSVGLHGSRGIHAGGHQSFGPGKDSAGPSSRQASARLSAESGRSPPEKRAGRVLVPPSSRWGRRSWRGGRSSGKSRMSSWRGRVRSSSSDGGGRKTLLTPLRPGPEAPRRPGPPP